MPALVISAGFFGGAFPLDKQQTTPSALFVLVYVGALLLSASCVSLSVGLFMA